MIDERDLAEMLARRARTISLTHIDAPRAARRARGRLVRNVGALIGIATVIWTLAGARSIG